MFQIPILFEANLSLILTVALVALVAGSPAIVPGFLRRGLSGDRIALTETCWSQRREINRL